MKKFLLVGCSLCLLTAAIAQDNKVKAPNANAVKDNTAPAAATSAPLENTLLWEISGNGLSHSSYLFGTMHILCAEDARLSDNLKKIIKEADLIYFEIDMDNMMEMLG